VTERDRAAVHVQLLPVDAEVTGGRDDLRRERLVELDQVDVVDGHAGASECLAARTDWPEPHDLGVQRRDAARDDAGQGSDPQLASARVAHHDDRRGAVVERARVARRDLAVGSERRLELRQLLDRGVGTRPVVLVDDAAVGQLDGDDLTLEEAALL
jgi:hypothetical protein